jgi:hypothetical protein
MSICRIRVILIVATLIATGLAAPAGAQTPLTEIRLTPEQRYWVTRTDGVEIRGYITARTPSEVQVSTDRGNVTIPTADVLRVTKRDGLTNGALIGAGVGAGFVLLAAAANHEEKLAGSAVMYVWAGAYGAAGAITGTIVDMVVNRRKAVYRKASTPSVQVAPTVLNGRLGIRGTVRW